MGLKSSAALRDRRRAQESVLHVKVTLRMMIISGDWSSAQIKIVTECRLIDFTALLSTRSNIQVETPSSRDWTEASTTEPSATTSAVEG